MTPEQINVARKRQGLSIADLARVLRTPYRTVQDWCSGARPVPGVAVVALGLLEQKNQWVMQAIVEKIKREVNG